MGSSFCQYMHFTNNSPKCMDNPVLNNSNITIASSRLNYDVSGVVTGLGFSAKIPIRF